MFLLCPKFIIRTDTVNVDCFTLIYGCLCLICLINGIYFTEDGINFDCYLDVYCLIFRLFILDDCWWI